MNFRRSLFVALNLGVLISGCAGHAARTKNARDALDRGDPVTALVELNAQLGVKNSAEVPADIGGEQSLVLLDRGSVLQQVNRPKDSSRDFQIADKQVEMLEFSRRTIDDVGKYLFSDSSGPYKAPAYEKIMINTLNMVNYLVRGDLSGARVEARRFSVVQRYFKERGNASSRISGLGSYLAGFTYEMSGNKAEAGSYYKEAMSQGEFPPAEPEECAYEEGCATVLVVVSYGRVPAKFARRIPIGLALTYAGALLSPRDHYLLGQGLVTWINYPELRSVRSYISPRVLFDGQPTVLAEPTSIDYAAARAWREARGSVVASAITRMRARAATGLAIREAGGRGLAASLLSLGTQVALSANDTPDTRSWSMLPARVRLARIQVPVGKHKVSFNGRGRQRVQSLNLKKGSWQVLHFSVLR